MAGRTIVIDIKVQFLLQRKLENGILKDTESLPTTPLDLSLIERKRIRLIFDYRKSWIIYLKQHVITYLDNKAEAHVS